MEDFITYYIENNSLTSINAFQMRSTFSEFVENYGYTTSQVNSFLSMIDYEQWIYENGCDPTNTLNFTVPTVTAAVNLANSYVSLNGTSSPANYQDYNTWPSNQRVVFVQTLMENSGINTNILSQIDDDLDITSSNDPEV